MDLTALSGRELQCATMAAQGYSAKEIARRLNISQGTVKIYWRQARIKTDTKNITHLAALVASVYPITTA